METPAASRDCQGSSFVDAGNGHSGPRHDFRPSCLHRDLLPFTLRLPQAILEASSFTDLETIANLGLGESSPRGQGSWWGIRNWGPRIAPGAACAEGQPESQLPWDHPHPCLRLLSRVTGAFLKSRLYQLPRTP